MCLSVCMLIHYTSDYFVSWVIIDGQKSEQATPLQWLQQGQPASYMAQIST